MILIRADANLHIGMGHIMRCLSLADAFRAALQKVEFIVADEGIASYIKDRGYEVFVLNSRYDEMEEELNLWPKVSPSMIIVDSYYVTDKYLRALNKRSKLAYIDDIAAFPYPVDILVNYNAYGMDIDYQSLYFPSGKPCLVLGVQYVPLRKMFRNLPKKKQKRDVTDVLFSTGGSDDLHMALTFVKQKPTEYVFHLLIGAMNQDKEEIRRLSADADNIVIHENVSDMQSLISSCDIAISAAGSTLYEICACGVPIITYITADNQIKGAEAFQKLGLVINYGDIRKKDQSMKGILYEVKKLASDYQRRTDTGYRMQEMIDGNGADRLVKKLLSCLLDVENPSS